MFDDETEEAEQWLNRQAEDSFSPAMRKGSDPRKLALTDPSFGGGRPQDWIARKLAMRSAANVSQQLGKLDGKRLYQRLPTTLAKWLNRLEAEL